jgi:hypothetical protein
MVRRDVRAAVGKLFFTEDCLEGFGMLIIRYIESVRLASVGGLLRSAKHIVELPIKRSSGGTVSEMTGKRYADE